MMFIKGTRRSRPISGTQNLEEQGVTTTQAVKALSNWRVTNSVYG